MAPPQLPAPNAQTPPPDRDHLRIMIDTAADDHLIERALAHAVINAESTYDPFAVSPVGALGLMQVMPATAADYGVASAADLFDPAINLATGMRHLRRLLDKYEGDVGLAVMAYNAGENALDRAETNLTIRETLIYTDRVIRAYIANGGRADVARTLMKLEQLRIIGAAGVVQHIARKSIDLSATSLDGLPPLAMRNIQARQSADR
ncbi:MAG: lytic transglycosylase domain-containing protein [Sphingobacteriia bacterium]|jgi:soluble lytic murein transglycosylase-like protein|nr:lytic transglycosylase domain-containing protein [Sphingobacteriia bacterium]